VTISRRCPPPAIRLWKTERRRKGTRVSRAIRRGLVTVTPVSGDGTIRLSARLLMGTEASYVSTVLHALLHQLREAHGVTRVVTTVSEAVLQTSARGDWPQLWRDGHVELACNMGVTRWSVRRNQTGADAPHPPAAPHRRAHVEKAFYSFMYRGSMVRRRRIPKNETAGESPDRARHLSGRATFPVPQDLARNTCGREQRLRLGQSGNLSAR
jgi:hypothetical protein